MKTEIEVKFIDVDIDEMRQCLERVGAVCEQPMRLMRRALVETPDMEQRNAFLRIRDEGHRTTMTFKMFERNALTGAKETETEVGSFEDTLAILKECGLDYRTFQESKRETWRLGEVEVVIDEWTWLAPYIEIEGETEEAVRKAAQQLGFEWDEAVFGSVDVIYERKFPDKTNRGVIDIQEVRFGAPIPREFTPSGSEV